MKRCFLLPLLVVFTQAGASRAAGARQPNVLFIAVDDLRPELGCYGQTHVVSPNIDQLAAGGVLFTRAYCQYSMCNPSRSSLMAGLRPDSTGVMDNGAHFRNKVPDAATLPQQFKLHGYVTQAFGKIFHGSFATAYVGRKCDDPPSWTEPHWYGSPQYYFTPVAVELYDYHNDPVERENITGRPENAALVKELAARFDKGWCAAPPPGFSQPDSTHQNKPQTKKTTP